MLRTKLSDSVREVRHRYAPPQTTQYTVSGDIQSAANWVCGGNLETPQTVSPEVVVRYKDEVSGKLDFRGSGVRPVDCTAREHNKKGAHEGHDNLDRD